MVEKPEQELTNFQKLKKLQNSLMTLGYDSKANIGSYSYEFVSLPKIRQTLQQFLNEFDWVILQPLEYNNGTQYLKTQFIDAKTGETIIESVVEIEDKANTSNIQKFGSVITYLRRYSIVSLLGLTTEQDDDGALAQENIKQKLSEMNTIAEVLKYFNTFSKKRQTSDKELIKMFSERKAEIESRNASIVNEAIIE